MTNRDQVQGQLVLSQLRAKLLEIIVVSAYRQTNSSPLSLSRFTPNPSHLPPPLQPDHVRTVTSRHVVSRANDGQLVSGTTYRVDDNRPFTTTANAVNQSLNMMRNADPGTTVSDHELTTRVRAK